MSKKSKVEEVAKKTENAETTPDTDTPASGALFPVPNDFEITQDGKHGHTHVERMTHVVTRTGVLATASAASTYFLPPTGDGQMETQDGQQPAVVMNGLTLEDLRAAMQHFTHERDWDKYHTPRNLLCALVTSKTTIQCVTCVMLDRSERWANCQRSFSGEGKWRGDYQVTDSVYLQSIHKCDAAQISQTMRRITLRKSSRT